MAEHAFTTRRALFAAAPAAALAGLAVAAHSAPPTSLLLQWEHLSRERSDADRRHWEEDDLFAFLDRWHADTGALLKAPIHTRGDAVAKLECANLFIEMGARDDGLDFRALAEIAAYLRGTL